MRALMARAHLRRGPSLSPRFVQVLRPTVKSPGVVFDGYRVIFMSGQARSAGMVGWVVTSSVSAESVTGRRRQRARTSRPR